MNRFAYANAPSVDETLTVLNKECRPLAGGTDILDMMKEKLVTPERLINVKAIPGLDQVEQRVDGWHVGALVRLTHLLEHPALQGKTEFECLLGALRETASPQIRNMATIGGNLLQRPRCWYFRNRLTFCLRKGGTHCFAFQGENKYHAILGGGPCYIVHPSDPAVALLAMDASVVIAGREGMHSLKLDNFYILPRQDPHREAALEADEMLIEVVVPTAPACTRGVYVKMGERAAWDFALVSAAVQVTMDGEVVQKAGLALGGVAPTPWRAKEAEAALLGQKLSDETIARAAAAATAGAKPLEQNGYKVEMVQGMVREALEQVAGRQPPVKEPGEKQSRDRKGAV